MEGGEGRKPCRLVQRPGTFWDPHLLVWGKVGVVARQYLVKNWMSIFFPFISSTVSPRSAETAPESHAPHSACLGIGTEPAPGKTQVNTHRLMSWVLLKCHRSNVERT